VTTRLAPVTTRAASGVCRCGEAGRCGVHRAVDSKAGRRGVHHAVNGEVGCSVDSCTHVKASGAGASKPVVAPASPPASRSTVHMPMRQAATRTWSGC
jgi:hypothetical protein